MTLDTGLLPPPGTPVLAAVSGGADSMALWDLLAERHPVAVWHLDHGLRPDAPADTATVQAFARHLADAGRPPLALRCERADIATLAAGWGTGIEEAGRRHRYARLAAVAAELGLAWVATAHHQDDQAETILLNLLRGSGPGGWCGIARRRPLAPGVELLRPLLGTARQTLHGHCRRRGIPWRDDPSNTDPSFRRNWVRHRVLPGIEGAVPGFTAALLGRAAQEAERHRGLAAAATAALDRGWQAEGGVALAALEGLDPGLRRECLAQCLRRLGVEVDRARLHRLDDLARGAPGRRLRLGPWLLLRRARRIEWSDQPWR